MPALLFNWRDTVTQQEDGSLAKVQAEAMDLKRGNTEQKDLNNRLRWFSNSVCNPFTSSFFLSWRYVCSEAELRLKKSQNICDNLLYFLRLYPNKWKGVVPPRPLGAVLSNIAYMSLLKEQNKRRHNNRNGTRESLDHGWPFFLSCIIIIIIDFCAY